MVDRSDGAKHFLSLILSISVANETDILKNNIIVIDEPEVHMHPSGIRYIREELLKIESIEKIEVKTLPVRQAIKSQLLNSMATFMSGSLINGNEQCIVGLNIIQKDKSNTLQSCG